MHDYWPIIIGRYGVGPRLGISSSPPRPAPAAAEEPGCSAGRVFWAVEEKGISFWGMRETKDHKLERSLVFFMTQKPSTLPIFHDAAVERGRGG